MTWYEVFADLDKRQEFALDIIPYPHPSLRHPAVLIKQFGHELTKLVRRMFDIIYERRGIGLAAPQLGLPFQLFVVNASVHQKEGSHETEFDVSKELVFINPVIQPKQKGRQPIRMESQTEGCLSIPGLYRNVVRPTTITFEALNAEGQSFKGEYSGLTARVIQHEYDHLHGRLFTDLVQDNEKQGVPQWLNYLSTQFDSQQEAGKIEGFDDIKKKLKELELLVS